MTEREAAAKAELEDTLRRLAPDLLNRDDSPLITSWTVVIATVPGDPDAVYDRGGDVDVLSPEGALMGAVIGDLRIATLAVEGDLMDSWS